MKKTIIYSILVLSFSAVFTSCKKGGTGGANILMVYPKHHDLAIPGATVYIKYGTNDFPGEDVSKYDASDIAEPGGHGDPHAHFENLTKGKYYLYGVGYDSTIGQVVKGGMPVEIKDKSGEKEVTLFITE